MRSSQGLAACKTLQLSQLPKLLLLCSMLEQMRDSAPADSAVRAGKVMSVTLGVIFAHTGTVALALIQPHTSCTSRSGTRLLRLQSNTSAMPVQPQCNVTSWKGLPMNAAAQLIALDWSTVELQETIKPHLQQFAVLPHGHAHLALRHAVRAAEVDLKGVHPGVLAPLEQLLPRRPIILLQHPQTVQQGRLSHLDNISRHRAERGQLQGLMNLTSSAAFQRKP